MYAIVDSGSSKADWAFIPEDGKRLDLSTMGYNPVLHAPQEFAAEIQSRFAPVVNPQAVRHVYFYGSGCWDGYYKDIVRSALRPFFPKAELHIFHDLLGAARATCQHDPGIACILGTGSNSCAYDGHKVVDNVTNLGYFLGDEGSGTHLGKLLIRSYFYREMPASLAPAFEQLVPGGKSEILRHLYGKEVPNRYLASFATFYSAHQSHPFIQALLVQSFGQFLEDHVLKYEDFLQHPVHFVGSIAHHFQIALQHACHQRGLEVGKIIQKPIHDLVYFHQAMVV